MIFEMRFDEMLLMASVWTGGWVVFVWGMGVIRAGRIRSGWRALAAVVGIGVGALAAVMAVAMFVLWGRVV